MYLEYSSLSAVGHLVEYSPPAVLGRVKKGGCRTLQAAPPGTAATRRRRWPAADGSDCLGRNTGLPAGAADKRIHQKH